MFSRFRALLTTIQACIFNEPLAEHLWGENYAYRYIKSNEKNRSKIQCLLKYSMTTNVKVTSMGIFYSFLDMYENSINAKKKERPNFDVREVGFPQDRTELKVA